MAWGPVRCFDATSAGFFDFDERLRELSAKSDAMERLNAIFDFELFRPDLAQAVPHSDRAKGSRPPWLSCRSAGDSAPMSRRPSVSVSA